MAKDFSAAIQEIMPLVTDGDKSTPFIITHDSAYGDWQVCYPYPADTADSFLKSQREHDPYAVKFTGANFADGDFSYVHDKVFCARLRAEYNCEPWGNLHEGEFSAVLNAFEDNIGHFSQNAIDYLLQQGEPLHELYDLNPIPLYDLDNPNNAPYDDERVDEFIEAVEYKIAELIEHPREELQEMSLRRSIRTTRNAILADISKRAAFTSLGATWYSPKTRPPPSRIWSAQSTGTTRSALRKRPQLR
ncbi:MAG: hypothetical protein LBU32_07035 [Clostridiales bacterium]|jgi:hypothetical protein|nr:hypothetical protein [Clostridiales bacterium]